MTGFYTIYEAFLSFMLVAAVVICLLNGATLIQLREKRKQHYRVWLLPAFLAGI